MATELDGKKDLPSSEFIHECNFYLLRLNI
jgi:hypothetical protein